jgi:hypothetical protein
MQLCFRSPDVGSALHELRRETDRHLRWGPHLVNGGIYVAKKSTNPPQAMNSENVSLPALSTKDYSGEGRCIPKIPQTSNSKTSGTVKLHVDVTALSLRPEHGDTHQHHAENRRSAQQRGAAHSPAQPVS